MLIIVFNLQIQEIAKEAGVITVNEFRTLLAFYHDLGILIHYGGPHVLDNALQRTVILKPQWLIDMFKRIITVKEGDQQVGKIPRKKWQISTHWDWDKMAATLADDIFKCIFLNENYRILIQISLKFIPKSPINKEVVLVLVMAWHRTGDKPLSEPMLARLTDAYMRH